MTSSINLDKLQGFLFVFSFFLNFSCNGLQNSFTVPYLDQAVHLNGILLYIKPWSNSLHEKLYHWFQIPSVLLPALQTLNSKMQTWRFLIKVGVQFSKGGWIAFTHIPPPCKETKTQFLLHNYNHTAITRGCPVHGSYTGHPAMSLCLWNNM